MSVSVIQENLIQQSKIIFALPTDNEEMESFEKTLSDGLSCVNNRLSFDSEILIPNLKKILKK